jgi:regulator of nonsense transcripts 2
LPLVKRQYIPPTSCFRLLTTTNRLSELLQVSMPHLPANTAKGDSIGLSSGNANRRLGADEDTYLSRGSQWEDEEERKFYEDLMDLKDLLPKGVGASTEGVSASANGDACAVGDGEAEESEEMHLERLGDVDDVEEEAVEEE